MGRPVDHGNRKVKREVHMGLLLLEVCGLDVLGIDSLYEDRGSIGTQNFGDITCPDLKFAAIYDIFQIMTLFPRHMEEHRWISS